MSSEHKSNKKTQKTNCSLTYWSFTIGIYAAGCIGIILILFIHFDNEAKKLKYPHYNHPEWSQFLIAFPLCSFHWILKSGFHYLFEDWAERYVSFNKDKKLIEKKKIKVLICGYKLFYFITSVVLGTYLLWNEEYMPPLLGFSNSNDPFKQYDNYPLLKNPEPARYYAIFDSAYHIFSMIDLVLFQKDRNDKIQMLFHHVVTLSLIIGSYMTNYIHTAVIVFLCHAWADVGVYFVKIFAECKSLPIAVSAWVLCLVLYVWNRFLVFIKDAIYVTIVLGFSDSNLGGTKPFVVLLLGLMCFHIYAFYMICFSGYRAMTGNLSTCDYQHEFQENKDEPQEKEKNIQKINGGSQIASNTKKRK